MDGASRANQKKWEDSLAALRVGSPLPPGAKVTIHTRSEQRPRRSRAACAAARRAEADARDVQLVYDWLMDAVVERAELNAALRIKDVVHAPRYGRVDLATDVEAFSHEADALGSDWGALGSDWDSAV